MQSAIYGLYYGSEETPIVADGGTFVLTFGAHSTGDIDWDASLSDVIAALEGLAGIGSGNIDVGEQADGDDNRIGLNLLFQGALANTPVAEMTVNSSLAIIAGDIDVETAQSGADPTLVTPSLTSPYAAAVAQVIGANQIQTLSLNGATDGFISFTSGGAYGLDVAAAIASGDFAGFWAAILDAAGNNGGYALTVTDAGGGNYNVEFTGANWQYTDVLANNHFAIILSATGTAVSATISVTQSPASPITGVPQDDTIAFSQAPTVGAWVLRTVGGDGTFQWSDVAATIQAWLRARILDVQVTGNTSSGFLITYSDFLVHDSSNGITGILNASDFPLGAGGALQIMTVALSEDPAPDLGEWYVTISGIASSHITLSDNGAAVTAKLSLAAGWVATGSAGGPYTFTAPYPAADAGFSATNVSLKKSVGAEIGVIQVGISGGGDSPATNTPLVIPNTRHHDNKFPASFLILGSS